MNAHQYLAMKLMLIDNGWAKEIDWASDIKPVKDAFQFWSEYAWVVLNSGMKNQIAQKIWDKVFPAVAKHGKSATTAFGHKGKANAIDNVYANRETMLAQFQSASDKLEYLESMPWIGPITKYHLAKNYGVDCCKPDRHLVRIANSFNLSVNEMCSNLAEITGDRIACVDAVIWRAANLGWV